MNSLKENQKDKLRDLCLRLLDQRNSRILVPPLGETTGFWFGGGNLVQQKNGKILVSGRYRNHGDARTGTGVGARGLEFGIFQADSCDSEFKKIFSLSKNDLSHKHEVISIEGGCLLPSMLDENKFELFVSTEKNIPYPKKLINFQKPGTGVWSIDLLCGSVGIDSLNKEKIRTIHQSEDPQSLHVKDPVAFRMNESRTELVFCHHSFSWSSSNTGLCIRNESQGEKCFSQVDNNVLSRENSWDVACTRVTERLPVPRIGCFQDLPDLSLYFYDGAECLRPLEENARASTRPRGYSCEELGGLAWGWDNEFPKMEKLSIDFPLFISPHGSGCSRYTSALSMQDGSIMATWQQGQSKGSQPLVSNLLSANEVKRILS